MTGAWPLSAVATILLLVPQLDGDYLLKVAVKELVLRGVWRLERVQRPIVLGGTKTYLYVVAGRCPVPELVPLPAADAALRRGWDGVHPRRVEVRELTTWLVRTEPLLGTRLADGTHTLLLGLGLLEASRDHVFGIRRTRRRRTAAGEAWKQDADHRAGRLRAELSNGPPGRATPALAAALGDAVLVYLPPSMLADLGVALRQQREDLRDFQQGGLQESPGGFDLNSFDFLDARLDRALEAGLVAGRGGH